MNIPPWVQIAMLTIYAVASLREITSFIRLVGHNRKPIVRAGVLGAYRYRAGEKFVTLIWLVVTVFLVSYIFFK